MLNYYDYDIYLTEIPHEISLGFSITGCPLRCKGCQWEVLWDRDKGEPLTLDVFSGICSKNREASCILFFGGEWDFHLMALLKFAKENHPRFNLALYSGQELSFFEDTEYMKLLDYLKVGQYVEELGGLQSPSTNQRLFRLEDGKIAEEYFLWRH